jgi:hypothetical protein
VQPGRDLPRLVLQEDEGDEQDEQRQRSHEEAHHLLDLAHGARTRPPRQRHHAVARPEEDHCEEEQVPDRGCERRAPLPAEHQRDSGRREHEHRDLEDTDAVGAGQRGPPTDPVRQHPRAQQDGEPDGDGGDVQPDREVALGRVGHLDQEDERQQRHRPREDVTRGAVVVDEVGEAPLQEPPFRLADGLIRQARPV